MIRTAAASIMMLVSLALATAALRGMDTRALTLMNVRMNGTNAENTRLA